MAFDLRLIVTELVTNSSRHADQNGSIRLVIDVSDSRLRGEVHDEGSGFDAPGTARLAGTEGGWGLQIVTALTSRWGVAATPTACVWFEIDLPPSPDAGRPRG